MYHNESIICYFIFIPSYNVTRFWVAYQYIMLQSIVVTTIASTHESLLAYTNYCLHINSFVDLFSLNTPTKYTIFLVYHVLHSVPTSRHILRRSVTDANILLVSVSESSAISVG
eukprot:Pompholyxophrys_punicea_v1_NODE_28_length_5163_cov_5.731206.p13 type:complete len:114 gc:universal NODE_28_length_5163_cov_5.731206:3332-3673(+)